MAKPQHEEIVEIKDPENEDGTLQVVIRFYKHRDGVLRPTAYVRATEHRGAGQAEVIAARTATAHRKAVNDVGILYSATKIWDSYPVRHGKVTITQQNLMMYLGNLVLGHSYGALAAAFGLSSRANIKRIIDKVDEASEEDDSFADVLLKMEKTMDGLQSTEGQP